MIPVCGGTVAKTGFPCRKPGKYGGYCGFHRRCDVEGCDEPRWWECSPAAFCRKHAKEHAEACVHCAGEYRRVTVPRYLF